MQQKHICAKVIFGDGHLPTQSSKFTLTSFNLSCVTLLSSYLFQITLGLSTDLTCDIK